MCYGQEIYTFVSNFPSKRSWVLLRYVLGDVFHTTYQFYNQKLWQYRSEVSSWCWLQCRLVSQISVHIILVISFSGNNKWTFMKRFRHIYNILANVSRHRGDCFRCGVAYISRVVCRPWPRLLEQIPTLSIPQTNNTTTVDYCFKSNNTLISQPCSRSI